MSQQALFLITTEKTVRDACKGWLPPLKEPQTRRRENPFTGKMYEVETRVPDEIERSDLNEPTIEELEAGLTNTAFFDQLSKAKPVCVEFTLSSEVYDIWKEAPPFLYGAIHGEVHEVVQFKPEQEAEILEHFTSEAGTWVDAEKRRGSNLSLFGYMYSF
jgi:hypothetical protein